MATKESGEFLAEVKARLDEWEERLNSWYIQRLPDMAELLGDLKERLEEFVAKIEDRFPDEEPDEPA